MIVGDIDKSKPCLDMLSKYIKVWPYEKHPRAMMAVYFERAANRVLGKNFSKERISQRKQTKLYKDVLEQLRGTYGKWINLMNWKVMPDLSIRFVTNVSLAFKTEFGPLYAPHSCYMARDVYYTGHCFERFEERADPDAYELARGPVERYIKAEPTAADVLMISADMSMGEYAEVNDAYYLNVGSGILVLDKYPEFFIAKTFLNPGMAIGTEDWKAPAVEGKSMWRHFQSLRQLFQAEYNRIKAPLYDTDLLALLKEIDSKENGDHEQSG